MQIRLTCTCKKNVCPILTLWYLKNVFSERHPRPMWENICKTLLAEPPVTRMAINSKKLPAGIPDPGMVGWLCHVFSFLHAEHVVLTTASVPNSLASTMGLSALHTWQNVNSKNSWERNTMCFGSVRRFVFFRNNLQWEKNV